MNSKTIIGPLQQWLLNQGRCIGCGRILAEEKKERENGVVLITCQCQRSFIYDPKDGTYSQSVQEKLAFA